MITAEAQRTQSLYRFVRILERGILTKGRFPRSVRKFKAFILLFTLPEKQKENSASATFAPLR